MRQGSCLQIDGVATALPGEPGPMREGGAEAVDQDTGLIPPLGSRGKGVPAIGEEEGEIGSGCDGREARGAIVEDLGESLAE